MEDDKLRWEPIQVFNVHKIIIDCNQKTPEQIYDEIINEVKEKELINTIVLIRLHGSLASGKPYDIDFKDIFQQLYDKSAYFVMKNTNALTTKEFEEIKIDTKSTEDAEAAIIKEHLGQIKLKDLDTEKEEALIKELMQTLSTEKQEGETNPDFENRVKQEVSKVLDVEL